MGVIYTDTMNTQNQHIKYRLPLQVLLDYANGELSEMEVAIVEDYLEENPDDLLVIEGAREFYIQEQSNREELEQFLEYGASDVDFLFGSQIRNITSSNTRRLYTWGVVAAVACFILLCIVSLKKNTPISKYQDLVILSYQDNCLKANFPRFSDNVTFISIAESNNNSFGSAATIGLFDRNLFFQNGAIHRPYNPTSIKEEGIIQLTDINGDGLSDLILRKNDIIYYKENLGTGFGPFQGIRFKYFSKGESEVLKRFPLHLSINGMGVKSKTPTSTYFVEVNGDGLLDIFHGGKFYLNNFNNRNPVRILNNIGISAPIFVQIKTSPKFHDSEGHIIESESDGFSLGSNYSAGKQSTSRNTNSKGANSIYQSTTSQSVKTPSSGTIAAILTSASIGINGSFEEVYEAMGFRNTYQEKHNDYGSGLGYSIGSSFSSGISFSRTKRETKEIEIPESLETQGYTPTSIKDLEAANPAAGIAQIEPPTANNLGTANINFLIKIPTGRIGLQPELSIQYNSDGGNGWMGLGWNLSVPSISIETRWGGPRYDAQKETETYLLNGIMLAPVAHRDTVFENRSADKQFYPRSEGNFKRIIRHGNSPQNYWWEITDKTGTTYYYGGMPATGVLSNAILKDDRGNIAHWNLVEKKGIEANYIRYFYQTVYDDGNRKGSVIGRSLYIDRIEYKGNSKNYSIDFVRDRELCLNRREALIISGKRGLKKVTADRLKRINIIANGKLIKSYDFMYSQDILNNSRLRWIIVNN